MIAMPNLQGRFREPVLPADCKPVEELKNFLFSSTQKGIAAITCFPAIDFVLLIGFNDFTFVFRCVRSSYLVIVLSQIEGE